MPLIFLFTCSICFISFAKFRSPWIQSPNRVNTYDMDALKADPAFAGKTNDALFKKLHDTFYDGRRQNFGDQNHQYYFHSPYLVFEPITSTSESRDAVWDPIKFFNVYGYSYCSWASACWTGIMEGFGYEARRWSLMGYHSVAEVYYNGGWHYFDTDLGGWGADPSGSVYSLDWVSKNPAAYMALPISQTSKSPASAGYFFNNDPAIAQEIANRYSGSTATHDVYNLGHDMSLCLRQGEYITRYWDIVNQADIISGTSWTIPTPNGRPAWSEGAIVYQPSLVSSSTDYLDGVYEESGIVQTATGLSSPSGGYAIFAVHSPYLLSKFTITESHTGGVTLAISTDLGNNWTNISAGLVSQAKGIYDFLVKMTLAPGAVLNTLKFETIFMFNAGTYPKLIAGTNNMKFYKYDATEELTYLENASSLGKLLTFNAPANGRFTHLSVAANFVRGVPPNTNDVVEVKAGNNPASLAQLAVNEQDFNTWTPSAADWEGGQNINIVKHALPSGSTQACVQVNRLNGTINYTKTLVRCYYDVVNGLTSTPSPVTITHAFNTASGEVTRTTTINASDFGANNFASYSVNAAGLTANTWVKMEVPSGAATQLHPAAAREQNSIDLVVSPNPFSREVRLEMRNVECGVRNYGIAIYNCNGKLVYSAIRIPNSRIHTWDARDMSGQSVPPGIYMVRLSSGTRDFVTKKILLVK